MTDIRQHIPIILTQIQRHLADATDTDTLLAELHANLPASYGLAPSSPIVEDEQGKQSMPPFDLIVYDKTLPGAQTSSPHAQPIQHVLAVVRLGESLSSAELTVLLRQIAQVKSMRSASQQKKKRPKILLPLGIVAFRDLSGVTATEPERLALILDQQLKRQPEPLRPDYLLAQEYGLTYQNPYHSNSVFVPTTINISREPRLKKPRACYVCKKPFQHAHFFYEYLCLACGDQNYARRAIPLDLTGRTALVTGGRIKIGYATALRLLRAGARVLLTTRFPRDAARRYSAEPDFARWSDRLHIYGLDFRNLPMLQHFIAYQQKTYTHLDILINNAAQTVRYPAEHYAQLLAFEQLPLASLPPAQQALIGRDYEVFPVAQPQLETAPLLGPQLPALSDQRNSWNLAFDEISLIEFLEVQVINVTAPWLLSSGLRPLLRQSPFPQRFIVNVSAVEGQFAASKQGTHVHTNMAKASLNMLTHSTAGDLARDGIFMNSVDPGWISQQSLPSDPERAQQIQQLIPLDLVDAAARICDPIFSGIASGTSGVGQFYKDYQSIPW